MDPTTIPPPVPKKSPPSPPPPPPQNPHNPPATIDASASDFYQKHEPSTNGNMDNFKALVSKLAGRFLPTHQSLIKRSLDDSFPDELLAPNHPPYADMILTALWELNTEGGSSEEAISNFILKEYRELPWAHATILNHHIRDLRMKGKIIMTHDRTYLRCLSTTKPLPSHPNLNDSSSSTPIPSPSSSSSSDSNWSSPTSSSSSLGWDPPNRRRRNRKRKRKIKKVKGGKMAQVRVRVRGRGSGSGRGRGRGRGRGKVTSDQNEVTDMKVEEDDEGEKQHNHPQEKNNGVVEKGFLEESHIKVMVSQKVDEQNENGKEKGEMVGLRRSGRRRNFVSEEHKVGAKEEYQQHFDDAVVIKLEDDVVTGDADEVGEHDESVKEQEERDARNVEHKEQAQHEEQETEVNQEPIHLPEQCVKMTNEKLESCGQNLLKDESTEEQPQHAEQETEVYQEPIHRQEKCAEMTNEKYQSCSQDLLKNESTKEQPQHKEQETEVNQEPIHRQEQCVEMTNEKLESCGQDLLKNESTEEQPQHKEQETEVNQEPIHRQEQCVEMTNEKLESCGQDLLKNESTEEQPQHKEQETEVNQEPIHRQEQCVEMTNEKLESCGQDLLKNESIEEQPQHEEQETEVNKKESGVVVMETDEQIDPQVEVEVSNDGNQEEQLNKVNKKDTEEQVELQNQDTVITSELQLQHEEPEPINKVLSVVLALMAVKSGSQEDDTVVGKIQPQKSLKEGVEKFAKRPLRERLRSSCKKQEPTPLPKKKHEQVVPVVRRSLRSNTIIAEEAVIDEGPAPSKEPLEYSGRTRSSKRISRSSEAEQVSKSKKTRMI